MLAGRRPIVATYTDPGFGAYLRTEPDTRMLAIYREKTGKALAELPRLVSVWRARSDSVAQDNCGPAQVEKWLQDHPGADDQDLADCRTYANIWMDL